MSQRGAVGLVVLLLLLVVVGALAWIFRDDLGRLVGWGGQTAVEVSPEAAAQAEAKLERLRTQGDTVQLSTIEIASLARYRYAGWIPDVLQDPTLSMAGDTLVLGGKIPTEQLPQVPELERVRMFLPDSAQVEISGHLRTMVPGQAAFEIHEVSVARVPLPSRFYPDLLRRIGRRDEAGLPPNAMPLGLPEGVGSARVEDGFLILTP